jgi:opacity protein-like surface antigen
MKKIFLIISFLLVVISASSQFEQKVSLNLSAGMFKTFGDKWGDVLPKQMPWYKPGFTGNLGIQFNINRRFSIVGEFGIMYSGKWECIQDDYNWMSYETWRFNPDTMLSSGLNKLKLLNFSFSLSPKLYFLPGKKLNPFIYAGISINYTLAPFEDNGWKDYVAFGLAAPEDTKPEIYLEKNFGLGLNPGAGIEYSPSEKLSLFLAGDYNLVFIKAKNYPYDYRSEIKGNLNAYQFKIGIRYSFIKSKNL